MGSRPPNISQIRRGLRRQFGVLRHACLPTVHLVKQALFTLLLVLTASLAGAARAQAVEGALANQVQRFALEATQQAAIPGLRVEVRLGRLDPRLHLAPCAVVQPYLPSGTRLWGAARIGLRCIDAATRWNVFLPINVDVYGPALVANAPLASGRVLGADDLRRAEVNLSASRAPAVTRSELAVGRTLAQPLAAGDALRESDLRARQWFAAGDNVRLVATGSGWRIHGEGQALGAGIEGQVIRVRTESGRIVNGAAVAERLVEVAL